MLQEHASEKAGLSQGEVTILYNKLAWIYDFWGILAESRARKCALELANIQFGEHILEVAVGTGLAFVKVVKSNSYGRNVGVDLSRGMLARAEQRLKKSGFSNYELSLGNALNLKEESHSFDLLLNNYMFDLLDESVWTEVLREFHRVLKPGGRLVMVNMTFGEQAGSGIYQIIYRLSPSLMGGCRGVRLSDVLQQNGFTVHKREYIQQLLFPSETLLATKSDAHGT